MHKTAKKYRAKTVLMQHGAMLEGSSAVNYSKILGGYFPILSNFFLGWGKNSIQCVDDSSTSIAKNIPVGSPNLDRIFSKKNNKSS